MFKNVCQVLIIEDDPYASDFMTMLLARDYRTQVISAITSKSTLDILDYFGNSPPEIQNSSALPFKSKEFDFTRPIDLIILDTEILWNENLPLKVAQTISSWKKIPKLLCTSTYPTNIILKQFLEYPFFSGYINKRDAVYSLATIVCLITQGYFVITPTVKSIVDEYFKRSAFPNQGLLVNSTKLSALQKEFSQTAREVVKLGLLFNLSQNDIQDEMGVSQTWVAKTLSNAYERLHLQEIVEDPDLLTEIFSTPHLSNEFIINYYKRLIDTFPKHVERHKDQSKNQKFKNMSTFAFHLFTIPEISEW